MGSTMTAEVKLFSQTTFAHRRGQQTDLTRTLRGYVFTMYTKNRCLAGATACTALQYKKHVSTHRNGAGLVLCPRHGVARPRHLIDSYLLAGQHL